MKSQADVFRLIDAQNEIVDYWSGVRGGKSLPGRRDIDPGALRAHLNSISILELGRAGEDPTFRLLGTHLRNMIGADMRGRSLDDLPASLAALWRTGLYSASQSLAPEHGVVDMGDSYHAWLRLPLQAEAGDCAPALMLCHDIVRRKKPRESRPVFCLRPLPGRAIAA